MDRLEEQLGRVLQDDRWALPPVADPVPAVHLGNRRRRRRRATAAGAAVLVLAAGGTAVGAGGDEGLAPASVAAAAPSGPCGFTDAIGRLELAVEDPVRGVTRGVLRLPALAQGSCLLAPPGGEPLFGLESAASSDLPLTADYVAGDAPLVLGPSPLELPVVLRGSSCDTSPVNGFLASGEDVALPVQVVGEIACTGRDTDLTATYGPVRPAGAPGDPVPARGVEVALRLPEGQAAPGRLAVDVVLHNRTAATVRLPDCPAYAVEVLDGEQPEPARFREEARLPCDSTPPALAAGEQVTVRLDLGVAAASTAGLLTVSLVDLPRSSVGLQIVPGTPGAPAATPVPLPTGAADPTSAPSASPTDSLD